jgi:hypothetical protein
MKKINATPESSPKPSEQAHSSAAQRQRVFQALLNARPKDLTTIQMREWLDAIVSAVSIFKLLHSADYNVQLVWDQDRNAEGNRHTCEGYFSLPGQRKHAA